VQLYARRCGISPTHSPAGRSGRRFRPRDIACR
jgi:hypothetical protein